MDYAASPFELKSLDDAGHIEGLLAGFGNVDHGGDKLLPGVFTKSLAARKSPLPMLLYHDMERPIGVWRDWQDHSDGLYVKGRLTLATRDAQEARALANDGALTGLSIGYKTVSAKRDTRGVRNITEANLHEGSLVAVPMNDRTRLTAVKSISAARDIKDMLRAGGMSERKAERAATAAWKSINQSDDDDQADTYLADILKQSAARIAAI